MTNVFLHGEVDLPPIPDHLFATINEYPIEKHVHDIGYGKVFYKKERRLNNCSYSKAIVDHQPLIDWIKNNLAFWNNAESLTIQKNIPIGNETNTTHPVHHDVRRMFALNYIISTGGSGVITSWYKDRKQPLIRSLNKSPGVQTDTGPVDYADCDCLDSMLFEQGKWYLINTSVLHDVDHVDSVRCSVTIPFFSTDIVEELKRQKLFRTMKEISDVT